MYTHTHTHVACVRALTNRPCVCLFPDLSMVDVENCKRSEIPVEPLYGFDVMEVGANSKACEATFLVADKEFHELKGYHRRKNRYYIDQLS